MDVNPKDDNPSSPESSDQSGDDSSPLDDNESEDGSESVLRRRCFTRRELGRSDFRSVIFTM